MQLSLTEPDSRPHKHELLYRYDPVVLIIHVRWHDTPDSFGKLVRDLLYLSYAGNEGSVGFAHPAWLPIVLTIITK